jgi:DNA polymerase-3 subunit beta
MKDKKGNGAMMQTQVSKLRETLKLLQLVVPKRVASHEALKCVLLGDGKAMANNLNVMVAIDYPEAQGQFLIPHQVVLDLLKYVPGNELLTIKQSGKHLKLTWESGNSSYDVPEPADFPPEPKIEEKTALSIDGDRLIDAMLSVVGYCATEETRPVLTCVNLSIGETIEVAAADGFRLAYQVIPIDSGVEDNINIPAKSVIVLSNLWSKSPPSVQLEDDLVRQLMNKRHIRLSRGDSALRAQFGQVILVAHLLDAQFPNYKQLIPNDPPVDVRCLASELERAIKSVKMASHAAHDRVYLEWTEDLLTVSAEGGDKGEVETKISVQASAPNKTAVNLGYLLEYLGGKEGLISIRITNSSSPVLLHHGKSPTVVIMPMSIGDKK